MIFSLFRDCQDQVQKSYSAKVDSCSRTLQQRPASGKLWALTRFLWFSFLQRSQWKSTEGMAEFMEKQQRLQKKKKKKTGLDPITIPTHANNSYSLNRATFFSATQNSYHHISSRLYFSWTLLITCSGVVDRRVDCASEMSSHRENMMQDIQDKFLIITAFSAVAKDTIY